MKPAGAGADSSGRRLFTFIALLHFLLYLFQLIFKVIQVVVLIFCCLKINLCCGLRCCDVFLFPFFVLGILLFDVFWSA